MTTAVSQLDLYMMAPAFILVATSIILLLFGAFQKGKKGLPYICLLGILLSFIVSVMLWNSRGYAFSKMIAVDNYSLFFHFIFLIATGLSVLISTDYLRVRGIESGEYYALLLLTVFGMILMASGLNLIIIFLGLEILSLSLYILTGFDRGEIRSIESSMKYFLLGAFATGFLLYGIALVYGASGSLRLDEIARFIKNNGMSHPLMFFMGTGLLIVGFGFKIASVPFHVWTPDVYEGAPTPVTAFMSIGAKAAGFAAFVRILMFAFGTEVHWVPLLWVLSALTMTLGNVVAISQTNIKRMLAYSAIAHTGYLLIGMVAKSSLGLHGILFYLLAYTFMNIGAFTVVIFLGKNGEENLNLEDYCGLGSKKPLLAGAMAIFMFSLSGIPPTAGFMGKFYLFSAAIKEGYIWLAVLGVMNSLISVYYYLRIVVLMYMKESVKEIGQPSLYLNLICALLITSFVTLYLGLFPSFSLSLIQQVFMVL
jgi:NADH-quinone oxidoreductase subunit N